MIESGLSTRAGIKKNKPNKNHKLFKLLHGYLFVKFFRYSAGEQFFRKSFAVRNHFLHTPFISVEMRTATALFP
jgi:hypothetical protein